MRIPSFPAVLPSGPARRPVLLLALGSFVLGTDAFVVSGVLPEVGRDLGLQLTAAGLLITVFAGGYALAAPVVAVITGGWCRRRLLLHALGVLVAADLLAVLAPDYRVLLAARVLAAFGAAAYMPAASASAAAVTEPAERGRALATVIGGLPLAGALGVPLGTLLGQAVHWRATFAFVAALGLVAAVELARALGPVPSPGVASLHDRFAAGGRPGVPMTLLSTFGAVGGIFVLYTYLAWFADGVAGLHGGAVTTIYLIFGVVGVLSNLIAGWLIDRLPAAQIAATSMVGLGVTFGLLAVLARVSSPAAATTVILAVLVGAWSLAGWLLNPAQQQRLLGAAGPQGPVVLSLNASAIYAGQAGGSVVGRLMLPHGPGPVALSAATCEVFAVCVLLRSMRRLGQPAVFESGRRADLPAPAAGSGSTS